MRRDRKRRKRAGNYFLQLGGAVALMVLSAGVVFAFLEKAAHPYWLNYTVNREVEAMRVKLAQQRAGNQALKKQIAYLSSPEGAEVRARRGGYHRPGEQVYLLPRPEEEGKPADGR